MSRETVENFKTPAKTDTGVELSTNQIVARQVHLAAHVWLRRGRDGGPTGKLVCIVCVADLSLGTQESVLHAYRE